MYVVYMGIFDIRKLARVIGRKYGFNIMFVKNIRFFNLTTVTLTFLLDRSAETAVTLIENHMHVLLYMSIYLR